MPARAGASDFELQEDGVVQHARFRSRLQFRREDLPPAHAKDGVLLEDEQYKVRAARFTGVAHAEPFHFSARYRGHEEAHRAEFLSAWQGSVSTS